MGKLDQPGFCSLYVAVDGYYLDKMVMTYPTWCLCHPEILRMDHVFVYDRNQLRVDDPRWGLIQKTREKQASLEGIPLRDTKFKLVPWELPEAASQRERMLTSLIRCALNVTTPWYLKLDADTFANKRTGFYFDKWFTGNPCYISSPWNYTKPAGTIAKMNEWAKGVPELMGYPEVQAKFVDMGNGKTKDVHPRMASWVMFGSTSWTIKASELCKEARLPFPSQDTYLSYIQARTGYPWVPVKFRQYGFEHMKNINGLQVACQHTIATGGLP